MAKRGLLPLYLFIGFFSEEGTVINWFWYQINSDLLKLTERVHSSTVFLKTLCKIDDNSLNI